VLRRISPRQLLWASMVSFAITFSALSALRHRAFSTGRFDLGNMVQAVWSTAQGDVLEATSLSGEQFVRLGAHFDPILATFAPAWLLWPSPTMLLTAQAVLIALGALPVFWLARKHLQSDRAALGFALAYLLLPPLQWMTLSEFHPVALATPLLLYAFWYLDEERLVAFAVFAGLAVLTKEHVALTVAVFGLWHAVSRRRLFPGLAISAAGVAVTAVAVGVVIPHFSPTGESSFYGRYGELGGSPGEVLRTLFTDPGEVAAELATRRDATYLFQLLLPLAALPFLAPLVLLGAAPEVGLNLLSATRTQTSIHFHYAAASLAALVPAAVLGAGWLVRIRPIRGRLALLVVLLSLGANYALGPIPVWQAFPGGEKLGTSAHRVNDHDRIAARALELVPGDAVVSTSNSLGGHLSERRRVLSFPLLADAEWIALDETRPGNADRIEPLPYAAAIARLRRNNGWRLVFQQDGVLIFRRIH
jgi:uncharacterized membrane protein